MVTTPLSAIVVNWNGKDYLESCLGALCAQEPRPEQILLLDNASEDGSREWVAEHFPQVEIVDTGANLGPAGARNRGAEIAQHDRLLFLDNDVYLQPGALAAMLRALDREGVVAVQPRSVVSSETETLHYDATDLSFLGTLTLHGFFEPVTEVDARTGEPAEGREVGSLIALCILCDREAFERAGGFDEKLFILYEDNDLSWRLRLQGGRLWRAKDAIAHHDLGTAGLSFRGEGARYSPQRTFLHVRNRASVVLRCTHVRTLILTAPARALYALTYLLFATLRGQLADVLRAYLAVASALPRLLRERRAIQRSRVRPDRELLTAHPMTANPGLADRGLKALLRRTLDSVFALWWKIVRPLCG